MTGEIDLSNLNERELTRLERILAALPPGQAVQQVDWEQIGEAVRKPEGSTVAGLLAKVKRSREQRGAKEFLKKRIAAIAERRRAGRARRGEPEPEPPPYEPVSAAQMRKRIDAAFASHRRSRSWADYCRATFGDHRFDANARPWPDMPDDWGEEATNKEKDHA